MSTGNKQPRPLSIDRLEAAIDRGQDISDTHFSPGGVSTGRTRGERREPTHKAHKVAAYRRNIDYGESLFHDLVAISNEMNISLQALAKMALQEWVMRYREHQERTTKRQENGPVPTSEDT
ncbi:MAG: hypothetical protein ETSY1_18540 [Candidatus Entotheonella factor]|uniref:Uncharacterized protein n=1 Tax=Entotheonella factor TaxID=1429438 RepID=W4LKH1_ENTF1|nr:hypothetical protein [Candidatus Entotheonella palauensis]ETW98482.1 MAG: hypothetical protein ETSY1_18540 [Candidatus Entotheonella factor]